jgi:hypothetical protein
MIDASFNIITSIVRVGVQNQIDLSWNQPLENGATIKNYFFYVEELPPLMHPLSTGPIIRMQYLSLILNHYCLLLEAQPDLL